MASSLELFITFNELPEIEPEVLTYLRRRKIGRVDDKQFFHLSTSARHVKIHEDGANVWPGWLPYDWKIKKKQRTNGKTKGVVDKVYISPCNKTFRSKVQAMKFLELQKELLEKNKA